MADKAKPKDAQMPGNELHARRDGAKDMTDQEMRIAIAETCGWYRLPQDSQTWAPRGWEHGKDVYGKLRPTSNLPDYLNDLNAMREALACIDSKQQEVFIYHLHRIVDSLDEREESSYWLILMATARQLAEAFIKTKGLNP